MLAALTHVLKTPRTRMAAATAPRALSTSTPSASTTQPHIKLSNGLLMPQLGLGTWRAGPGEVKAAVKSALAAGYRHFDCAAIYGNEREVGEGLKEGLAELGLKRGDIWVTSKLWNAKHRPDLVRGACEQTLHDLDLEYLDLYLMHWPVDQIPAEGPKVGGDPSTTETPLWETYDAMQELVTEGLTKTIGVSNFSVRELEELIKDTDLIPTVNQIEMHPYLIQSKLLDYCQAKNITITAYSPLGRAAKPKTGELPSLIEHPAVVAIAQRRDKTPAQVLLRWAIQRDVTVIPKSAHDGRIKENFQIFDFILDDADMAALNALNCMHRYVRPSFHNFVDDNIEGDGVL